jgi:hypothetical protein
VWRAVGFGNERVRETDSAVERHERDFIYRNQMLVWAYFLPELQIHTEAMRIKRQICWSRGKSNYGESEALPYPPSCRGIALDNGTLAGGPYGSGELRPLTGPCDCPVCHGSGYEGMIATWVPHQDFGDPERCGFLFGLVRDGEGYIGCNVCTAVVRKMPADQLRQVLNEMESGLELASEQCPHSGKVNLFPGFSTLLAYTCRECGEMVRLSDDPEMDRIFGPEQDGY